jgi:3-dehydroquinate dehydratase type I
LTAEEILCSIKLKEKNMKPTFLNREKPLKTCMIQVREPLDFVCLAREGMFDQADAFGFQIEQFKKENRTEQIYRDMFKVTCDKPIYVTNYRGGINEGSTDEELAEGLMLALKAGGTLMDVMGDYYDRTEGELTVNEDAIKKQMALIDRIHEAGGEVLMSSHVLKYIPKERVLEIALEHQRRGADIAKIVTAANNDDEMMEALEAIHLLKKNLDIPFLFLVGGTHSKMVRAVGPLLGSCMWLCVERYDALATKSQPLLRCVKEIVNNFDYLPERE